ncbi:replication/maintenance protein RepL [Vibrio sp. OPT18]|uniref:replication/maintenance protein RepL n=1 Tax=Vibrio sp. OPT18 TaxID=2778641 RepID=UPI001881DE02|nr:replication/maintenance protein RepL [Vibrio sp. OPT18]MBE8574049.1 replication/maintenance protein RepL [Vibrio sp. OPT18]
MSKAEKRKQKWTTVEDENGNHVKCPVDDDGEIFLRNPEFIQFVRGGYSAVKELLREKPLAGNIFMWMVEYMDKNNRLIVSYDALIEEFGKSRMTIYNAITHLKEKKFLDIMKSGNSNIYCLNSNIVWQNSAENRKFASFSCAVYVTKSEQAKKDHIPRIVK